MENLQINQIAFAIQIQTRFLFPFYLPFLSHGLEHVRVNPDIAAKPELADEVIYKLRAVLIAVNQVGLVKANEEFYKWMTGEKTMPFGDNNRHVPIKLIDFEELSNNTYIVTNQYRIHHRETKIPDVVMMINGIPVVVGEAKTPIRPSVSWLDGAHEVHDIYENAVPQLFVPNILSFATEGKELYYGAIRCPLEFWAPWRLENDEDAIAKRLGLGEVGKASCSETVQNQIVISFFIGSRKNQFGIVDEAGLIVVFRPICQRLGGSR
mgnify:CR=1 FL=1